MRRFTTTACCVLISALLLAAQLFANERSEKTNAQPVSSHQASEETPTKTSSQPISLGAYDADGNSPGSIVFRSYNDHPVWYDAGHLIDWRHKTKIHMIYMEQPFPGDDEIDQWRRPVVDFFDASIAPGGQFSGGVGGQPIYSNPFLETGREPQLAVDDDGNVIAVSARYTPVHLGDPRNQETPDVVWDLSGSGLFDGDTLPQSQSQDPASSISYPQIVFQEMAGYPLTHVLATEFDPVRATTYWRREGGRGTQGVWTTPLQLPESNGGNAKICAGSSLPFVSIVYLGALDSADAGYVPYVVQSTSLGINWGTPEQVIDFDYSSDGWSGWTDIQATYDSDDFLHIVFNTTAYDAETRSSALSINPTRILHWTDRVSGPHNGGTLSTVAHVELNLASLCGRGWTNELNTARQVISECNERLYVIWQQFGESNYPLDCASGSVIGYEGSSNSELMMAVSMSRDGSMWDYRRNLTNSHSPGCDGSAGNECDSDQYPSVARFGMSTSSLGATYWSSIPEIFEIRDHLDPTWSVDSTYIDLMYVDDAFPGNTRWSPSNHIWTNNPVKWARIPCVPPLLTASMVVDYGAILYPKDQVAGGDVTFDIKVENTGNYSLNVISISPIYVTETGWLQVYPDHMILGPGSDSVVTLTLNPGGALTPGAGGVEIEGYVRFISDDPNQPRDSFYIHTVITDTTRYFESFEVVANGDGPIDPPLPGALASAGFPTPGNADPGEDQQAGVGTWAIHINDNGSSSGGGSRGNYYSFLNRALRGGYNGPDVLNMDFEIRFTAGLHYAYRAYSDQNAVEVPFELWRTGNNTPDDSSDDVRMIPWLWDSENDGFNLENWGNTGNGGGDYEHSASVDDDDPYTSWIYWMMPHDSSPGDGGYYADTDDIIDGLYDDSDVEEVMARMVLINIDGGIEPPFNQAWPEEGTVFRIRGVKTGCCGEYTSGFTGDTDCDGEGKRNLADITVLIDHVYITKLPLCCEENGNIDGDIENKTNLADITSLIDHVYINKAETAICD